MSKKTLANIVAIALLVFIAVRKFGPDDWSFDKILPIPVPVDVTPKPGSWLVIIEESEERSVELAKTIADANWLASIEARGAKWRVYDDDLASAASYVAAANPARPTVVLVDAQGNPLAKSDDVSREALSALLKEKAGL